jgi:hypothetical protein
MLADRRTPQKGFLQPFLGFVIPVIATAGTLFGNHGLGLKPRSRAVSPW